MSHSLQSKSIEKVLIITVVREKPCWVRSEKLWRSTGSRIVGRGGFKHPQRSCGITDSDSSYHTKAETNNGCIFHSE